MRYPAHVNGDVGGLTVAVLVIGGCIPLQPAEDQHEDPQTLARAEAERDLGCAAVELREVPAESSEGRAFSAEGCGQVASYEVICSRKNECAVVRQDELTVSSTPAEPGARSGRQPASSTQPPAGAEPASSSEPHARGTVSVTLRSSCPETVKVFFGDKPRFSSGRTSSVSGNSRRNESLRVGDTIWLLDSGGDGIASVTVSESTREVEVSRECSALMAH